MGYYGGSSGGDGAPSDASFLTVDSDPDLSAERRLELGEDLQALDTEPPTTFTLSLAGYLRVLRSIMSALGAGDTNIQGVYLDSGYVGLLLNRNHVTTATWNTSTAQYTVPVGKKAVIVEMGVSDGCVTDTGNNKVRLYNVTDSSVILPDSYFSSATRFLALREGAWGAAGKQIQLQSWHGNGDVKPSGFVILRIVDA